MSYSDASLDKRWTRVGLLLSWSHPLGSATEMMGKVIPNDSNSASSASNDDPAKRL